jgi:hypothetical protein
MSITAAQLRYPKVRALLPRTRLAYVHLKNLLTDAKRDRTARVFGYVGIWLPDEFLMLYMEEGEVVNATGTTDGRHWRALPLSEAVGKVPSAAEYGEICFHQAADEQLAAMFATQLMPDVAWPAELALRDTQAVLAHLMATLFDGVMEVMDGGAMHYVVFKHGMPLRGYFADGELSNDLSLHLRVVLDSALRHAGSVRRWDVPSALANQAAPALITAYRDFMGSVVQSLTDRGSAGAVAVAEQARQMLMGRHPALEKFSLLVPHPRDPVVTAPELSAAIAAWLKETLWLTHLPDGQAPERLIAELARGRRHLFQAAGLFDALPWTIPW